MSNKFINRILIGFLTLSFASVNVSLAQNIDTVKTHTLLVRDSLDFSNKHLKINTSSNEFSPIPYKGGLMYISNQPIKEAKVAFNKIYWTEDPNFNIIDQEQIKVSTGKSITKYIKLGRGDDFTAPTSNDNDILVNYKKLINQWNNVERSFINFSTDQAFSYNDSTNLLVYVKKSNKRVNGVRHWELWQANLINGRLRHKQRIVFDDRNANYLYPFLTNDISRLYFSSNKKGTKGGYDIYYVNLKDNAWQTNPIQLDSNINTLADELAPFVTNDSLYFSSNREGGLGGFDVYSTTFSHPLCVLNQGYPLNSEGDEVSFKKHSNNYFLTTNRAGNFDIVSMQYLPVVYPVHGKLTYKNDGTLVTNHSLLLKDLLTDKIVDTIMTDEQARYQFSGKPNRNYQFLTMNGDSVLEMFNYTTVPNQQNFEYTFSIHGRSPKQKADSLQTLWAIAEQRRQDSVALYGLATKFIVHFGFNKSIIDTKEKVVLDSLLIKLNKLPNTYIVVGAFTDCIGSYRYNKKLSIRRGKSVVHYLMQHGLSKQRFITNGYANKYNVTPCTTGYAKNKKQLQQNNRRAEIVLSEIKHTEWATLEKQRGQGYYSNYNASSLVKPTIRVFVKAPLDVKKTENRKDTVVIAKVAPIIIKPTVKKDTVVVTKITPVLMKPVVKNDTTIIAKNVSKVVKPSLKKDTIVVAKIAPIVVKPVVKNDTTFIAKNVSKVVKPVFKKDTTIIARVNNDLKKEKDTIKPFEPKVIIAKASEINVDDDLSKAEIIQALDSLANLKREQERIVEYLTKRINKKPIDVFVNSDSVTVELYDNGIHDKDSVSVIYNNRIIIDRQELKVNKPIKFMLKVDKNKKNNELVLVAENLGSEPPNTAVMFITEKTGRRQQIMLSTDMTHNEVVYFIRIGKE